MAARVIKKMTVGPTYQVGDTVKLEGVDDKRRRVYIGRVIGSAPNEIIVRVGDAWTNRYVFKNGTWVAEMTKPGGKVPRSRVIGLVYTNNNASEGVQ